MGAWWRSDFRCGWPRSVCRSVTLFRSCDYSLSLPKLWPRTIAYKSGQIPSCRKQPVANLRYLQQDLIFDLSSLPLSYTLQRIRVGRTDQSLRKDADLNEISCRFGSNHCRSCDCLHASGSTYYYKGKRDPRDTSGSCFPFHKMNQLTMIAAAIPLTLRTPSMSTRYRPSFQDLHREAGDYK